ncbi:DEAD/DEAH box helicase [Paenibacillus ginsengarvi]|uniref:DEAD/DEAH box helicase n=1 Tax=Paenibacillus ginsengarvi TaxID=400777 RepID=UPI0013152F3C|nr:ATP-binding protein [Paenibacillus ginsengarvi]
MIEKQIYLFQEDETIEYDSLIPFACTTNFVNSFSSSGILWEDFIWNLQNNRLFLMMKNKKGTSIQILLDKVVLNCVINEDCFAIKHLSPKTVRAQNMFIKNGVKLKSERGAIVWKDNLIFTYATIQDRDRARIGFAHMLPKLNLLLSEDAGEKRGQNQEYDTVEAVDDEDDGVEKIEELLEIAQFYNEAEDEIQQSDSLSGSRLGYFRFTANSDHTRVEKLAYTFDVSDFDKNQYKKGSRVKVNSLLEDGFAGTIVNIQDEAKPGRMTILFDDKFDIHDLPSAGDIGLEYNPVQKQVRDAVIDDIRSGTSRAQYFDYMLRDKSVLSFEPTDVSSLVQNLRERKYPPNPSQIQAIVKGIEAKEALLVLGPPGTGKTTVILEWVKHFVKEGKRVLISSQNNKAVDNVLERLAKEKHIETIRVGSEEKVQTNIHPFMFERKSIQLQQNITKATQKHLQFLYSDKDKVREYEELVDRGQQSWLQYEAMNRQVHAAYASITEHTIRPLKSAYEQYQTVVHHAERFKLKIEQRLQDIASYQKSNKLMKLLRYPMHQLNLRRFKSSYEQYQTLAAQEAQLADSYNRLYKTMQEQLAEPVFVSAKESLLELHSHCEKWALMLQQTPRFDSFLPAIELPGTGIDSIDILNDKALLDDVRKQCADLHQRIEWIQGAVTNWNGYLAQKQNYALAQVLLDSVNLVGATCIGINSQPRFRDIQFDVTIIDEAGQIQIHNAIVPMSRSPKVIMLGDHLQIPPSKESRVEARCNEIGISTELLGTSFFEYLYKRFPESNKMLLDTQYRMPKEIADILSEWFYEGKYISFDGKSGMKSALPSLFKKTFALVSTSDYERRHEVKVQGEGYYNPYECRLVIHLLQEALQTINPDTVNPGSPSYIVGGRHFLPSEIGVITPYKYQVNYVRKMVSKHLAQLSQDEVNDMVASLDSFQGQERPIIIYSCTRSNGLSPEAARIGFLKELRRLNVALSRCQQQLVFVGDIDFLATCNYQMRDSAGEVLTDENGDPLSGTSEKEFADFMRLILDSVKQGKAELVLSRQLHGLLQNMSRGAQ